MSRDLKTFLVRLAALGAAACSSVYAVHSAPDQSIAADRPLARSPYAVELLADDGGALETYERGGRFYVMGSHGDRYSIRIKNPTARRVEAVISVDGLDVIDGLDADFKKKRGYVVPPYGELVVDGFRMSTTEVAAFRFSSVGESYAERKGKGRNVGVVGVAIFAEKDDPQLVMPAPEPVARGGYDRDEYEAKADDGRYGRAPARQGNAGPASGKSAPTATAEASPATPSTRPADAPRVSRRPAPPPHGGELDIGGDMGGADTTCCRETPAPRQERPGLGTQWGEQRYSAVDFTRFVRASATVPTAVAELRYNDADGLSAMGILVRPQPDPDEVMRRETADPFPASGFATPPADHQ
jgi:hypothetical protein